MAEAPASARPGNHGQDGGEGDGRQEAEENVAADRLGQVHDRHVAAADQLAADLAAFEEGRILVPTMVIAEAPRIIDDQEEEADEAGGVEDRLAGFLGVRHGEEAHHDVRQAGGTEEQAERQRDGGDRISHQRARGHHLDRRILCAARPPW